MSEQHEPRRMQQPMPEDGGGWHQINAGPHLHMMFHPNRQLLGRTADGIERPSIVVAVVGKREQALRFDPFSVGSHYHIRPGLAGQIPLGVGEGQSPLGAALAFFQNPATRPLREELHAGAQQSPAALLAQLDRIERQLERIEVERAPT